MAGGQEDCRAPHNFPLALPDHLAEQAEEALKSSYNLEFLGIRQAVKERELENQLIDKLRDFIRTSEHFHELLKEQGITCSMSRAGEVWDNSAMKSFFSSLKTEHTASKVYRTRE